MNSTSKILLGALALSLPGIAFADADLPTVTIMGKTFYTYVAKKGESLFGIASRFGWDPEILANTNKELDTPLSNGDLIYYPAPKADKGKGTKGKSDGTAPTEVASTVVEESSPEPTYVVVDQTSEVELDPEADSEADGYVLHIIQPDDSLFSIARTYETTVEDLYRLNPGLSYGNPEPGEKIRIKTGSRNENAEPKMMQEEHINGLTTYKVRRGDDWVSIAEANGITVDVLKQANPKLFKLKRGDTITIPNVETVEVERMVVETDPREETEEGRRELYNEVHSLDSKIYDADGNISPNAISVAIVLAAPDTNRDMEFARGALLAVDNMKSLSFPTRLTIIDGSQSQTEVLGAIEGFAPTLIITTAEKDFPDYITAYAEENSKHVINTFDVKSDAYTKYPSVIQYLAPTSYFNEEVADYLTDTYAGYSLLIAGKMEGSDTMGEAILKAYIDESDEMPQEIVIEELPEFELDAEDGRYLIYATPSGKDDVKGLLSKITSLRDRYPMADIRVVGRPNWITMADAQRDAFRENGVLLPTRFYFDADEAPSRKFIDSFKTLYGHTPMKSYPVYSATAYDILTYFMPNISRTGGDFNAGFHTYATLQSPISLTREENWGGMVNTNVYIVEFRPFGGEKKITLNPED